MKWSKSRTSKYIHLKNIQNCLVIWYPFQMYGNIAAWFKKSIRKVLIQRVWSEAKAGHPNTYTSKTSKNCRLVIWYPFQMWYSDISDIHVLSYRLELDPFSCCNQIADESEGAENNVFFTKASGFRLNIKHAYSPQMLPLGQLQASRHLKLIGVTCLQDHHTGVHPVAADATSREAVVIACRPGFAQGCLSKWRFHGTLLRSCSRQLLPNQHIDLEICCSNCWDGWFFCWLRKLLIWFKWRVVLVDQSKPNTANPKLIIHCWPRYLVSGTIPTRAARAAVRTSRGLCDKVSEQMNFFTSTQQSVAVGATRRLPLSTIKFSGISAGFSCRHRCTTIISIFVKSIIVWKCMYSRWKLPKKKWYSS